MSRCQDRTWYVLPVERKMIWKTFDHEIPIVVMAFSFDGDEMIWVTVNGTKVSSTEAVSAA